MLSVPVQESPLGWIYKDAVVKIGSPFSFETAPTPWTAASSMSR